MRMTEITTLTVAACPSKIAYVDDSPKTRDYGFQISQAPVITTQSCSEELPSSSVARMLRLPTFSAAPTSLVVFFKTICPGMYENVNTYHVM